MVINNQFRVIIYLSFFFFFLWAPYPFLLSLFFFFPLRESGHHHHRHSHPLFSLFSFIHHQHHHLFSFSFSIVIIISRSSCIGCHYPVISVCTCYCPSSTVNHHPQHHLFKSVAPASLPSPLWSASFTISFLTFLDRYQHHDHLTFSSAWQRLFFFVFVSIDSLPPSATIPPHLVDQHHHLSTFFSLHRQISSAVINCSTIILFYRLAGGPSSSPSSQHHHFFSCFGITSFPRLHLHDRHHLHQLLLSLSCCNCCEYVDWCFNCCCFSFFSSAT